MPKDVLFSHGMIREIPPSLIKWEVWFYHRISDPRSNTQTSLQISLGMIYPWIRSHW